MRYLLPGLIMLSSIGFGEQTIGKLKDLHLETLLVENDEPRALLVAPTAEGYSPVAELVRAEVAGLTKAELDVETPEELTDQDLQRFNLILLGNAADNAFVRRLVWERWLFDTWHPGDDTFVVRSIHNPFGHGKNVMFIGGENPVTVRAAAEKFLGMLRPGDPLSVGWVMTSETDKRGAPVTEDTIKAQMASADKALSFKNGRTLISGAAAMAKRYYSRPPTVAKAR